MRRSFTDKLSIRTKMGPKKGKKGKKADDDWGNAEEDEKKLEEKMKALAVEEEDGGEEKGKKLECSRVRISVRNVNGVVPIYVLFR